MISHRVFPFLILHVFPFTSKWWLKLTLLHFDESLFRFNCSMFKTTLVIDCTSSFVDWVALHRFKDWALSSNDELYPLKPKQASSHNVRKDMETTGTAWYISACSPGSHNPGHRFRELRFYSPALQIESNYSSRAHHIWYSRPEDDMNGALSMLNLKTTISPQDLIPTPKGDPEVFMGVLRRRARLKICWKRPMIGKPEIWTLFSSATAGRTIYLC
jgi:hypothetical protein